MTQINTMTGVANGELWGHRALDWAKYQEATMAPVFDAVLDRTGVTEGTRLLDIGCGAGLAAAKASALGAVVTGLDASNALVGIARSRLPASDFHIGDLQDLPFDDGSFDLVTSFNAIQYAGDVVKALSEIKRVLAPGGKVAIATWGDPEGMEAAKVVTVIKPLLPPPPPNAPGPFALSDDTLLREFVERGGFQSYDMFDVDSPWFYPDQEAALAGLAASGVAAKAISLAGQEAVDQAHLSAIEPYRKADGSIEFSATFKVVLARRAID
ncbi:MAG: class I SAM-dependent methyltransferase [Pseudomonadota bacterium]